MKIISNKFPFNIPSILAPFISAIFLSFYLTGLIFEIQFGRPSSTSAIGFIFIPIYAVFLLLAGFVVGIIVRSIVERYVSERLLTKKTIYIIYLSFLLSVAISSIAGGISFKVYENAQKPHVLLKTAVVEKNTSIKYIETDLIEAAFPLSIFDDDKNKLSTLVWNNKKVRFNLVKDANSLTLLDDTGIELVSIDLRKFDYITRVNAVPVAVDESDRKGLAVLVHLRSTSRRSMLFIYNANGDLLYQELLYRTGVDNVLKAIKDESGKEYLWLNVDTPVIYAFKRQ